MTRNLKGLGLALIAVFALSALVASPVQAKPQATCEQYPCVLTGEAIEHGELGSTHRFTVAGKSVTCTTVKYDSTISSAAESEEVVTVTPTYKGCSANPGSLPVTITMNGCDTRIHGGKEDKEGHFVEVELDLTCPVGKKAEIHFYSNAEKHALGSSLCTIKIPPINNVVANTDTNIAGSPDHVTLITSVSGIPAEAHPEGLVCGKTNQTGTFTGATTLKAYEDKGNHTNEAGETVYTEGAQIGLTISDGE